MKFALLLSSLLFFTNICLAQPIIEAVTQEGKKVILKPDKTWDYAPIPKTKEEKTSQTDDAFIFTKENLRTLTKSEFETEAQYQSRLIGFYTKLGKPFVIKSQPSFFSYYAESQRFRVSIYGEGKIKFVERRFGMNSSTTIAFDFPIDPIEASKIKDDVEFYIYGYPAGFDMFDELQFIATKVEVKDKKNGRVYFTKDIPSYFTGKALSNIEKINDEIRANGSSTTNGNGSGSTPGTDVRVKGYYRRDGTYVRPHTRSAPRRRN